MLVDMERIYNYYALALTILNPKYTTEKALQYFSPADLESAKRVKEEEVEDMRKLKKEMTYPQLAEIFGREPSYICRQIKKGGPS